MKAGQGDPELMSEELVRIADPALVSVSRAGETLISPDLTETSAGPRASSHRPSTPWFHILNLRPGSLQILGELLVLCFQRGIERLEFLEPTD